MQGIQEAVKREVPMIGVGILAGLLLVSGCSTETAKRTAYETLQNKQQQECLKTPGADCSRHDSYDDYQRKRKELNPPE